MDIYFINLNLEQCILKDKILLNKIHHNLSRLFLKHILEKTYNIKSEILEKNKKPYILNNPLFFNISHSENIIGIVFDKYEVGLDIEYKRKRNIIGLLKHYGLEKEKLTHEEFYQLWTVYEAEYKSGNQNKLISFNYKNYMCSISCKYDIVDNFFEIMITNPKLYNLDKNIDKTDYNICSLDFSNVKLLKKLGLKIFSKK